MLQQIHPVVDTCAVCGRIITQSETPDVWQQSIVCADCHERLSEQSIAMAFSAPRHPDSDDSPGWIVVAATVMAILGGGGALAWWTLAQ
jgi:hypothetical protein